jgi:hypothetical protein
MAEMGAKQPRRILAERHRAEAGQALGPMQLILVAIVILWPESVTYWIRDRQTMDPAALRSS